MGEGEEDALVGSVLLLEVWWGLNMGESHRIRQFIINAPQPTYN
jgi:hypothetical protein